MLRFEVYSDGRPAEQVGLQPIGYSQRSLRIPPQPRVTFLQRHLPWMAPVAVLLCVWAVLRVLAGQEEQALPPREYTSTVARQESEPPPEEPDAGPRGTAPEALPPTEPDNNVTSPPPHPPDDVPSLGRFGYRFGTAHVRRFCQTSHRAYSPP